MKTYFVLPFALALATAASHAQQHAVHPQQAATPYAGLEQRAIKALSAQELRAWTEGEGAGHALAAELNGYPGPSHVLEHARALALSSDQERQTRDLLERHKSEVKRLGKELVELERELDSLFAEKRAGDGGQVALLAQSIGSLAGRIRASHLLTHVRQAALLSPEQINHYDRLRGYKAQHHGAR